MTARGGFGVTRLVTPLAAAACLALPAAALAQEEGGPPEQQNNNEQTGQNNNSNQTNQNCQADGDCTQTNTTNQTINNGGPRVVRPVQPTRVVRPTVVHPQRQVVLVRRVPLARTGSKTWLIGLLGAGSLAGGLGLLAAQRRGRLLESSA